MYYLDKRNNEKNPEIILLALYSEEVTEYFTIKTIKISTSIILFSNFLSHKRKPVNNPIMSWPFWIFQPSKAVVQPLLPTWILTIDGF